MSFSRCHAERNVPNDINLKYRLHVHWPAVSPAISFVARPRRSFSCQIRLHGRGVRSWRASLDARLRLLLNIKVGRQGYVLAYSCPPPAVLSALCPCLFAAAVCLRARARKAEPLGCKADACALLQAIHWHLLRPRKRWQRQLGAQVSVSLALLSHCSIPFDAVFSCISRLAQPCGCSRIR